MGSHSFSGGMVSSGSSKTPSSIKKKKPVTPKPVKSLSQPQVCMLIQVPNLLALFMESIIHSTF